MKNYTDMASAELRKMLREDSLKTSGEGKTFTELQPILKVLAFRDGITQEKAEKAWADFVKYYLPSAEE